MSEVSGEAPVPPSKPEMVTWSARALADARGDCVPTPTSETSFTGDAGAAGVDVLRGRG